jgi:hypothetical protein
VDAPLADGVTVLWRLTRGRSTAHATVLGTVPPLTVTWFFDGRMDRVENYDTLDLAMARADHIRSVLVTEGWKEAGSPGQDEDAG